MFSFTLTFVFIKIPFLKISDYLFISKCMHLVDSIILFHVLSFAYASSGTDTAYLHTPV